MGSNKFRKDPLYVHAKSANHAASVMRYDHSNKPIKDTPIGKAVVRLQKEQHRKLTGLFNTACAIAKNCCPFRSKCCPCEAFPTPNETGFTALLLRLRSGQNPISVLQCCHLCYSLKKVPTVLLNSQLLILLTSLVPFAADIS